MKPIVFAVMLCAVGGCAWRVQTAPVPGYPPPPASPRPAPVAMMTYDEAVQLGSRYAAERGFAFRLSKAELERKHVWELRFDVRRHKSHGHLDLHYDAHSRALLKAKEKLDKGRGHRDRDDDDHDAKHAGRHKHGHGKHGH